MSKVIVLGSLNMDLVVTTDRLPTPGETLKGRAFATYPGGKGANQAVGAARLGCDVSMMGRVGDDDFGQSLINILAMENVDTSGISLDSSEKTGIAIICVDSNGENTIVAVYGANMACGPQEIEATAERISESSVLLLQNEIPAFTSQSISARCKEIGTTIVWDPAPASNEHIHLLQVSDFVTPNEIEATALAGIEVSTVDSAIKACEIISSMGKATPIIKMGDLGVVYMDAHQIKHQIGFEVDAIDTVAAGDAFNAGFAVALTEGLNVNGAVRFACAAGALATTKYGAQSAMPFRNEVDSFLKK